ncbi:beta-1,3-galactosyltransferase 2 [Amia ocellicauda]|uniref:beta-1,3-galactosyltransferase 2 n=1 Tax=Amia ocellicauda TaxID=2972642 RepID=UPI0034647765|nr:B3GT2 galactosyltransferase [Amia calva]
MWKTWCWRLGKCLVFTGLACWLAFWVWKAAGSLEWGQGSCVDPQLYKIAPPSTYKYVLNEPDKCRGRTPFLVLMVPVAPHDSPARDAIRKTWGQENSVPGVEILRIFMLGLSSGDQASQIQVKLERESQKHRDIIQKNFLDSYRNLTIKTMAIMEWLASYCPEASYAMKIDTDMFLNVDYLVNKLLNPRAPHPKKDFITGVVIGDGRPRRDKESKWYMPEDVYPETDYPPYVSGTGYVFSVNLARKILWASSSVRPVPLEDIYVGLCLQRLCIHPTRSSWRSLFNLHSMAYERCAFSRLITVAGFWPGRLLQVWHDFRQARFTC